MDYFKMYKLMRETQASDPTSTQQMPAPEAGAAIPKEDDPSIVVRGAVQAYKSAFNTMKDEILRTVADASTKLAQAGSYAAGTLAHKDLPDAHRGTSPAQTGKGIEKLTPMADLGGGDEKVQSMVSAFEKWKQNRAQAAGGK